MALRRLATGGSLAPWTWHRVFGGSTWRVQGASSGWALNRPSAAAEVRGMMTDATTAGRPPGGGPVPVARAPQQLRRGQGMPPEMVAGQQEIEEAVGAGHVGMEEEGVGDAEAGDGALAVPAPGEGLAAGAAAEPAPAAPEAVTNELKSAPVHMLVEVRREPSGVSDSQSPRKSERLKTHAQLAGSDRGCRGHDTAAGDGDVQARIYQPHGGKTEGDADPIIALRRRKGGVRSARATKGAVEERSRGRRAGRGRVPSRARGAFRLRGAGASGGDRHRHGHNHKQQIGFIQSATAPCAKLLQARGAV